MASIQLVPIDKQGRGAFNGGEILENKPIGFPQDRSSVGPYSSLFYWAHARAVKDSTIGLHPHQGFEICSFVLKGNIRHFDTKLNEWRPLSTGDVQIIRAGNGISHAEFMAGNAEMFQIWFDPNLGRTLNQPASYDDYRSMDFPTETLENMQVTTIVGPGSPMRMDTPDVQIHRFSSELPQTHSVPANPSIVYSIYIISGAATINDSAAQATDFVVLRDQTELRFETSAQTDIFMIQSPARLSYPTYAEYMTR